MISFGCDVLHLLHSAECPLPICPELTQVVNAVTPAWLATGLPLEQIFRKSQFLDKGAKNSYNFNDFDGFHGDMTMDSELSEREKEILKFVICSFISQAAPVASRYVAKHHYLGLSPASIRNTLADLEDLGYITHPHTSAGRIPTDKGYRFFVDWLMDVSPLSGDEKGNIKRVLDVATEADGLLHQTAKILGTISHQLCIVSAPHLHTATLERIELVFVSANKILVVLTIQSGLVRTITMEVLTEVTQETLSNITSLLNERLCGLTLETIRQTFGDRMKDYRNERSGVMNVFIRTADRIFDDARDREKFHIGGTRSLVEQPEYISDPENLRTVLELINNESRVVEMLQGVECDQQQGLAIFIGEENRAEEMKNYSILVTTYKAGDVSGNIGVIGPKRMDYQKVIPLIRYITDEVSTTLS